MILQQVLVAIQTPNPETFSLENIAGEVLAGSGLGESGRREFL